LAAIAASGQSPEGEDPPPFRLRAVNSLWLQRDYPVLAEYLDTLAASYDAGLNLLDFIADPEGSRRTINDAVAVATEDRIEELIPEGVITDLTRLVLTNAVYFKANWASEFDPAATAPAPFRLADGTETTVPMMHTSATVDFAHGRGFVAAWLPYVGDASMMVLLPEGDLADLLADLSPEDLQAANQARLAHMVDLAVPRFEFRSQLTLAPLLQELGMEAAFVPPPAPGSADLTGITAVRELYVQDVVHEGFVKVDEKGTEAAAATAVVVGVTSLPPAATLHLDRPFLFLISHESTGEILFAGVVARP
jgi:serpin B